jgi:two-component system sensor histidine kinase CssS
MKIWITFSTLILIIVFSSSFLYVDVFRNYEKDSKIENLRVSHDILAASNNLKDLSNKLNEVKNLKDVKHFILNISKDNQIYISDIKQKKDKKYEIEEDGMKVWMAGFVKGDKSYEKQITAYYEKKQVIFIVTPIKGNNIGKSYLISYMKYTYDNKLLYIIIGIGIIFVVLGFFIAKIVANYISKPLKELEIFAKKIACKNWNEPIKTSSEDEIGRLAKAMNEMQKSLKSADEEEKIFLQSISHDLKTPVMVIMSHAEAIIDGIYVESVENTAEIIKNEAISLQKKLKQLIYLNTLDYILQNNNKNIKINLQELLLNTINRFKVINSKVAWKVNTSETCIYGNIDKIEVVIENILDNQLRYAKKKISINLEEKGECIVLEIYNDGPNIDEKHIEHIFDNLYKDKTGNFGLGLAICRKIISFYKGKIFAVNREIGVSFIVKLPSVKN